MISKLILLVLACTLTITSSERLFPLKNDTVSEWFSEMNEEALKLNILAAEATWKMSVGNPDDQAVEEAASVATARSSWRKKVCEQASTFDSRFMKDSEKRQIWLLCRGVDFKYEETKLIDDILNDMQTIYTASKICIATNQNNSNSSNEEKIFEYLKMMQHEADKNKPEYLKLSDISDKVIWSAASVNALDGKNNELACFSGEPDLERVMSHSKQEEVSKWTWLVWRQATGPAIKPLYRKMVSIANVAAQRKGYLNMGEIWREELEIPNLEELVDELYDDVKDLYTLLHGVAKHFISKKYNQEESCDDRFIEAHLTGNMWGQNWENILDIIYDLPKNMDLNYMLKKTNWTSRDMVKRAEDFYSSLGLPLMTKRFWKYSYFGEKSHNSNNGDEIKCHGTAANMYRDDDYRMIYCANLSMEDFYVIHHELGHIQYFMAYDKKLPTIFMDGTNSAFSESIGDAIMLGVMAPQHLLRLGLIDDQSVYIYPKDTAKSLKLNMATEKKYDELHLSDEYAVDFDKILLMYQGLSKIPHVPFGYIIDKYRWNIFSEKIKPSHYNSEFWNFVINYQGISPPNKILRGEEYFDAASKYHVPDNTPYIRYFLSSFLQVQIFKGMCQLSLFGAVDPERPLPMPLHRCDIYGSKKVGHKLREVMEKGSSIHWSEALYNLTGEKTISSKPFLEYFHPLKIYLSRLVKHHEIPLGW